MNEGRLRGAVVRVVAVTGMVVSTIAVGTVSAPNPVQAVSPNIVISQVYGGGGNSGATLTNDFIELFNRGTTAVNIAGWSVQYASSAGTTWQVTGVSGIVQPGQYYLVQESGGALGTTPLPTPDALGSINMSAVSGKVALVNTTAPLTGIGCPFGATTVDFVGYGSTANCSEGSPTGTLNNFDAAIRASGGCTETDDNSADFAVGPAAPRNSASPVNSCAPTDLAPTVTSTTPAGGASNVAVGANLTVDFSEAVNVSGSWFDITCTISGSHAAVASGGPTSFTLDPVVDFANSDSCTATVFAAQVTDQDAIDPPDNMAANFSWTFAVDVHAPPSVSAGGPYAVVEGGSVTVSATGSDPDGDTLTYVWDLDDNGSFETAGQNVSFSAASLNAPDTHTIRVRATDPGGQSATSTTTVSIRYPFSGFLPPVKAPPAINSAKAGRVIPVKFSLGGSRGTNILAAGSPSSRPVDCSTLAPIGAATATVSKSNLKHKAATGKYKYLWSTKKSWTGTCREFLLSLDDGSEHSFVVAFK